MEDEYAYTEVFSGEADAMALLTKPFMFYPDISSNDPPTQKKRKLPDGESCSSNTLTVMQSMMSEQHAHILSLNKHILAITGAHHVALTEADKKHRDEREHLEKLCSDLRRQLNEARDQIRHMENPQVKQIVVVEKEPEPQALPQQQQQLIVPKKEVFAAKTIALYSWEVV